MCVEQLPHLNAALNLLATILLLSGFVLIRLKRIKAHKWAMLSCFGVSCLFLTSYLIYHVSVPSKPFPRSDYGSAWAIGYYVILASHIVLATVLPILAIITIVLGLRNRRRAHRKIARWTFPIWLYVSVTGVVIYVMLYQLFPPLTDNGGV